MAELYLDRLPLQENLWISVMYSELRRDEIELLRRLLVALTKVKNDDDKEDQRECH